MAKVLHFYNVFGAATERTMLEVPMALAGRGHELTFAAETRAGDSVSVEQRLLEIERIHVESTDDIDGQMQAIAEAPPAIDESFELVHGHFGPRCLHAARYLHRGVPVVISTYGYDVSRLLRDPCWGERYRWMGQHGAVLVALSDAMADTLRRVGVPSGQVEMIPLGIELLRWVYRPPEEIGPFLFVGRFVDKKAPEVVIAAVARLRQRGVEAKLRLIGGGDEAYENRLRQLTDELGIEDAVEFVGYVDYEALPETMRQARAVVVPSRVAADGDSEGCPMVLMQAQAVGTPVITTRHAGNPEALPPAPGAQRFVVPENEVEALASAMQKMLEITYEERRQLQAAGRAWVEEHFDIERTVDRYDALYRRLAL
ncbi:MAG: glycosyltransferase family 4 protein [Planctomycetota bacterium]